MKLNYRGNEYDNTAAVAPTAEQYAQGSYRGVAVNLQNGTPAVLPTAELKFRGAVYTYSTPVAAPVADASTEQAIAASTVAPVSTDDRARSLMLNHHRTVKRRQQVMLSRLANQVGMEAGASSYWNHIQGKVHPSFWATYDRSGAALS